MSYVKICTSNEEAYLWTVCRGLTPAEADLYFLDNAKKCAMYGMDMYPVKDSSGREVSRVRFVVFTNNNTWFWSVYYLSRRNTLNVYANIVLCQLTGKSGSKCMWPVRLSWEVTDRVF